MGEFNISREVIRRSTNNVTPATGVTGVEFKIPTRSNRRLIKAELHLNITISAAMVAGTSSFRAEGFVAKAKFEASDNGESKRTIIEAPGSHLLAWHMKHAGRASAAQQELFGAGVTGSAQTLDYILPMHFVHPASRMPMGYLQSIPFQKRTNGFGLGDDALFTFDFAAINSVHMGLNTGTVTVNYYQLVLYWLDLPPVGSPGRLPDRYAPSELAVVDYDNGAVASTNARLALPKDGRLTSFVAFTFATPATGILGEVLTNGQNAGLYRILANKTEFDSFTAVLARHDDELYQVAYSDFTAPGVTNNLNANIWSKNFWHNTPDGDGNNLNSVPNLYTENRGDLLELEIDNWIASTRVRLLTHKFLVTDPALLAGA